MKNMQFSSSSNSEKIGKAAGFVLMYLVFTIIAFFIFSLTKRLPDEWSFFHVMPFTLAIVLLGSLIQLLVRN